MTMDKNIKVESRYKNEIIIEITDCVVSSCMCVFETIEFSKCLVNSQKPHSFPSTLTLIHREAIIRTMNSKICVTLN